MCLALGRAFSVMGYEAVSVGPLHVDRQSFWEIVDHEIEVLNTAKFAAIVGIGPDFAYGNKEKTLLMSYDIDQFSVCLQKPPGSVGYLTWGPEQGFDKEVAVTAQVIGKFHWVTALHNVTYVEPAGHLAQVPCGSSQGCAAIIDSGTSLIAGPRSALNQLGAQIPAVQEDCSNLKELPKLRFVIDGHQFELPPEAYVMRITGAILEADNIWDILFFKPKIRKVDICAPAFMEIDMMSQFGPVWIMGMPFFRYYHTTFDRPNKAMHFSRAGPGCEPLPFEKGGSGNSTGFLATGPTVQDSDDGPLLDVKVDALIPPTLSGMMDVPPNGRQGTLEL